MSGDNKWYWLPGLSVGLTSMIVGYPADTLKVRLQTGMYPSLSACFMKTYQIDGLLGFYRGSLMPLITMGIRRSYQYPLFEKLKLTNSNYLAGTIAGGSGTLIGCPAHVLKVQMQNSHQTQLNNIWQCSRDIIQKDGLIKGFYRGFHINFIKDVGFGCLFLGTYGSLKDLLKEKKRKNELLWNHYNLDNDLNMVLAGTLAGCLSSLIAWTILFPVDTIKTAIQSRKGWELIQSKKKLGFLSFWDGLSPVIIRSIPVSLTSMFAYEIVTWFIDS